MRIPISTMCVPLALSVIPSLSPLMTRHFKAHKAFCFITKQYNYKINIPLHLSATISRLFLSRLLLLDCQQHTNVKKSLLKFQPCVEYNIYKHKQKTYEDCSTNTCALENRNHTNRLRTDMLFNKYHFTLGGPHWYI